MFSTVSKNTLARTYLQVIGGWFLASTTHPSLDDSYYDFTWKHPLFKFRWRIVLLYPYIVSSLKIWNATPDLSLGGSRGNLIVYGLVSSNTVAKRPLAAGQSLKTKDPRRSKCLCRQTPRKIRLGL